MHHNKTTFTTLTHNATIAYTKQPMRNVQKLKETKSNSMKRMEVEIQTPNNLYNV
jgi:hypothetical protein